MAGEERLEFAIHFAIQHKRALASACMICLVPAPREPVVAATTSPAPLDPGTSATARMTLPAWCMLAWLHFAPLHHAWHGCHHELHAVTDTACNYCSATKWPGRVDTWSSSGHLGAMQWGRRGSCRLCTQCTSVGLP